MDNALELIYAIFNKFFTWVFSFYIFPGVSLGMLFVAIYVFVIMLNFVVAIPHVHVGASDNNSHTPASKKGGGNYGN